MKDSIIEILQTHENYLILFGTLITVVASFITFAITRISSKNRFKHENTLKCIEAYRKILEKGGIDDKNVLVYLGLINEELFYIKNRLVNPKIGKEWIAYIINYLPIFYSENKKIIVVNENVLKARMEFFRLDSRYHYIFSYPRIFNILSVEKSDLEILFRELKNEVLALSENGEFKIIACNDIKDEFEKLNDITLVKNALAYLIYKNLMKKNCSGILSFVKLKFRLRHKKFA